MPSPFEVPFAEVQANIDLFVDEVFASLQSGFMTLPKGPGFIEYPTFEHGYEALKRTTRGFRDMSPEPVLSLVWQTPLAGHILDFGLEENLQYLPAGVWACTCRPCGRLALASGRGRGRAAVRC